MKNSQKAELRADIRELSKKGYSKKEAIKTLIEYGYCNSTARMYWEVFSGKEELTSKIKGKEKGE